ncbi:MAG: ChaN family lipoprotein [Thermodesulfobacteriota bacterium]
MYRIIVICFALSLLSGTTAMAAADGQRLLLRYDAAAGVMRGEARIVLPAAKAMDLSLGGLTVARVTLDGDALTPAATLHFDASDRERVLSVEYTASGDQQGASGNRIGDDGIVLLGNWLPVPSEPLPLVLEARLPAGFAAVSEAEEVVRTEEAGGVRVTMTFTRPVREAAFVAGPYLVEEIAFGDGRTLATFFFAEDGELAAGYREKALGYLGRYEKLIGPFPYRRFSIVENRLPTGYAIPTFTLLGQGVARLPFIVDTSLGHEILHQWFGNAVQPAAESGNWSEGLATYLADQLYAADRGEGGDYRKGQLIRYASYVNSDNDRPLREFFGADLDRTPMAKSNRAIGYDKGGMLFHMLRTTLGDETFYAALSRFYQRRKFTTAGWEDLRAAFEEVSGSALGEFFEQWLTRADIPNLAVDNAHAGYEDGLAVVRFTLRQTTAEPYRLVVPVTFYRSGGAPLEKIVPIDTASREVVIPVEHTPEYLAIDPGYDLMRALSEDELPPVWSRFEGAGRKIAVLPRGADSARNTPILEVLRELGGELRKEEELKDSDLAAASVLFLDAACDRARGLFADSSISGPGVTVDVRRNPLSGDQVMVLLSAADSRQLELAAPKLTHYGKYGYLHFVDGRLREKKIPNSDAGMLYRIDFPPNGIETSRLDGFGRLMDRVAAARVVHVGEVHTSTGDHDLQLRVIRELYGRNPDLAIGMEMFSKSGQKALDDYIGGHIDEKEFLKSSNYFIQWGFDYRLYRDILQYARRHRIPVLGLNVDKGISGKIAKGGVYDGLTQEEAAALPVDRDLDIAGYYQRLEGVFSLHGGHGDFGNFLQAQGVWDETMAATAADYIAAHPDRRLVIIAGRGHVVRGTGIPPRLARRLPSLPQVVVMNAASGEPGDDDADIIFFNSAPPLPPPAIMGVQLQEKDGEVVVIGVADNSPAARAGIRKDDVLLTLDGQPVASAADVKILMLDHGKGDEVAAGLRRQQLFGTVDVQAQVVL